MKKNSYGVASEQSKIGEAIIKLLGLTVNEYGKVKTSVGDKNAVNLCLTIQKIIQGEIK